MSREEEIYEATSGFGLWNVGEAMFKLGAEWADEHPSQQSLARELSRLGYTITLNGDIISKEEENKMMENYVKYQKKQLIEKACEWLISKSTIENSSNVNIFVNGASYHSVYDFIKDFQKAMEE